MIIVLCADRDHFLFSFVLYLNSNYCLILLKEKYIFVLNSSVVFGHIPFLQEYSAEVDSVIAIWKEYKMAVPTYGAILLDKEMKNVSIYFIVSIFSL